MNKPVYMNIAEHYEKCFREHGQTAKGADWPNEEDLNTRFKTMLDIVDFKKNKNPEILDLGCGFGLFLEYIEKHGKADSMTYTGIDLSESMIQAAKQRWPDREFYVRDILREPLEKQSVDFVVMNGLLTEKVNLKQNEMVEFAKKIILAAYNVCRTGIAFNVMSKHVDWERDDLFHWGYDEVAEFLVKKCSRHIILRSDYGLYEYTIYVFREPNSA